jgi:hypothetical protein
LKPGGYLILHLVDRSKFNMDFIIEKQIVKPEPYDIFYFVNELFPQKKENSVVFNGVKYESNYNNENVAKNEVTWKERFTDKKTGKIRENEHHFFMESKETILLYTKECGFGIKNETNYNESPFEFMVMLYRMN